MPRLERDSTPATAMASVKLRPRPTSYRTSVVTSMQPTMDMITDRTAAMKSFPRMAEMKPEMSSSSSPTRKKKIKMPIVSSS